MSSKIFIAAIYLIFAVAVFSCSIADYAGAEADILFSDGFETDDFSKWSHADDKWKTVTNISNAHSGSQRAELKGSTIGEQILEIQKSTADHSNIVLDYWYKIGASLETSDYVIVEWSVNGNSWDFIASYSAVGEGNWTNEQRSLPDSTANASGFRFRFRGSLNATSDVFRLDDVRLIGEAPVPTSSPGPTSTSTSTPASDPAAAPTPLPAVSEIPTQTPTPTPITTTTPTPAPTLTPTPIATSTPTPNSVPTPTEIPSPTNISTPLPSLPAPTVLTPNPVVPAQAKLPSSKILTSPSPKVLPVKNLSSEPTNEFTETPKQIAPSLLAAVEKIPFKKISIIAGLLVIIYLIAVRLNKNKKAE